MQTCRPQRCDLIRNEDGAAAIELAFVAPVFVMLLLAAFDVGFSMYGTTVLRGEVENAARTASLENHLFSDIEGRVNTQVRTVIPSSDADTKVSFDLDRYYYANYSDVERPEDFTDANNNGEWDTNECFVDRNANRKFDLDVGLAGRGGAQDVVAIKGEVEFDRVFPGWKFMGGPDDMTLTANTYLRNQPFSAQAARVGVRICP